MSLCSREMCDINLDGNRIRACLDCPAEMECVIRLLCDCMYGVEKTAVEWRLENCDKIDKYLNTSPLDWLNFDVSFHEQSLNQLHCLLTPNTYLNAEVRRNGKTERL